MTTQPPTAMPVETVALEMDQLHVLNRFYKRNGHKGKARPGDHAFVLHLNGQVLAGVRFEVMAEGWLMRGLWVHRNWRGQGLGRQLLQGCEVQWSAQPCYCYPYRELAAFYTRIGFVAVEEHVAPRLQTLLSRYRRRGEDVGLMRFSGLVRSTDYTDSIDSQPLSS
ncbi:GNAT family N-acetyltransferase [Marinobacterium weihaiense]|uniref:GNAT family N-acetyltransferase n=1 Tax=Marinobacterium weihaiense TaxID=2851016 RepID=A0ABS6MDY4_9GAMM|nr:GNAT family N-acetyltransferase [Marinobacterium weihaiense]MBV0934513.1 GNAT family N-acetyltransferase [Marinobacterium weihaiense]